MFDKEAFLSQGTTEAGSTTYPTVPDGDYPAVIDKVDYNEVKGEQGIAPQLLVFWHLQSPQLESITNMKKSVVRQTLWLDLLANGGFDMSKGKNVSLNRVRDAIGQNVPGQQWNPKMMVGRPGVVRVTTRSAPDGRMFNDVSQVAKMAA